MSPRSLTRGRGIPLSTIFLGVDGVENCLRVDAASLKLTLIWQQVFYVGLFKREGSVLGVGGGERSTDLLPLLLLAHLQ